MHKSDLLNKHTPIFEKKSITGNILMMQDGSLGVKRVGVQPQNILLKHLYLWLWWFICIKKV